MWLCSLQWGSICVSRCWANSEASLCPIHVLLLCIKTVPTQFSCAYQNWGRGIPLFSQSCCLHCKKRHNSIFLSPSSTTGAETWKAERFSHCVCGLPTWDTDKSSKCGKAWCLLQARRRHHALYMFNFPASYTYLLSNNSKCNLPSCRSTARKSENLWY